MSALLKSVRGDLLRLTILGFGLFGCGQSSTDGSTSSTEPTGTGGGVSSGGAPATTGTRGTESTKPMATGGNKPGTTKVTGGGGKTGAIVGTGGNSAPGIPGAGGAGHVTPPPPAGGAGSSGSKVSTIPTPPAGGAPSTTSGTGSVPVGTTCPATALAAGDTNKTIQVGSDSRTYILHVPAAYDGKKAVPLVVDFHPIGGSGSGERGSSPYKAQTDPEGVITVYPDGKSGPMGGAWNVGPCCVANVDDVAFAKALVAEVQKVACIDPKRIYAVGFSMGGGMSHYSACHAADVFAAVAPAAFDLLKENVDACKPSRPITVVSFRGTGDNVVPYAGGGSSVVSGMPITFLGAKGTLDAWAKINGCTGTASAADSNNCQTYSTCKDGVQVTLCTKQGGGHEAGNASVGWPLLKKYTMP